MRCFGRNFDDHCCYVNGAVCPFLEENSERGQRWSCQLRRETGSWSAAVADPRYTETKASPGPYFAQFGYDCQTFQCRECRQFESGQIDRVEFLRSKAR